MIIDKTLTFATANLFNFMEPPGAFYDFENIYESKEWNDKCLWTKKKILALNADIIGLQEVFSFDSLQCLFNEMGYQYTACIDQPNVEQDYIHSQPVVAIASKYPIVRLEAVTPIECIQNHYQTTIPKFSRNPLFAIIDVPQIGEIAVYVCHLKSQRPTESNNPDFTNPIVGKWISSLQRGWESLMLRLFMEHQYESHPVPTVLMGDMNQPMTSDITGLLTEELNGDTEQLTLQDSWHLYCGGNLSIERPPTHYHFSKGNILDYILLSQEFHLHSQYSLADVIKYETLDKHLTNPSFQQDKQASDHAFVAVTVSFVL